MVAKTPALRQRSMAQVIAELERCTSAGTVKKAPSPVPTEQKVVAETLDFSGKAAAYAGTAPTQDAPAPTRSTQAPRSAQSKRRVAAPKRSEKRQSQWDDAVKAADRDYKRRHNIGWFNKLRTALGKTTGLVAGLTVVAITVAAVYFGVTHVWHDSSLRRECRSRVLEAVAPMVKEEGFEPISALELTNAPAWQAVPDEVTFEANLTQNTNTGRRPVAKLRGKMQRSTGRLIVGVDRFNGTDIRDFRIDVKPVP
jgi:negative regulator of sigma E activity